MWCSRRLLALHPPLRIPHPEFKSVPGSASGSPSHAEHWRPGVIKLLSKTSRFSRTGRNFVSKFQLDSLEVCFKSASFILGPGGAKLSKRNFLLRCHSKVDFFLLTAAETKNLRVASVHPDAWESIIQTET